MIRNRAWAGGSARRFMSIFSKRRQRAGRFQFESLEARRLLSADFSSYLVRPEWFQQFPPTEDIAAAVSDVSPPAQSKATEKTSQWIVQLNDAATAQLTSIDDSRDLLQGKLDFELLGGLGRVGQVLIATANSDVKAAFKWLSANPHVAYFEPNLNVWSIDASPNDGRLSELWGMNNTGQTGGGTDSDIDAFEAWDLTRGSSSVVVGVIDTGVDYNHPDLAANIWTNPGEIAGNNLDDDRNGFVDDIHGYDFVNNDGDPMDDEGHGTHVSGTIAAVGDNNVGVVGVNWSSAIMGLKFLDAGGSGTTANAIRAVNYATMMREQYEINVRVTNNSWGGGGFNQALQDAIAAGGNRGILFVAAAGNDAEDGDLTPHYPAGYDVPTILTVAATDHRDALARFSNYGAESVDVAAPGDGILSTLPNNTYGVYSGTSMATPHVAGVAALAWALSPDFTVNQVRDAIVSGVDVLAPLDGRLVSGGRLNARGTLDRLGMNVSATTPAGGSTVSTPPTEFQVSFTYNFDPETLDPADFQVNDLPANSVTVVDGNTAAFTFATSPVTVEGPQSMNIAQGAIARQGNPETVRAWESLFYFDTLPTAVVSSDPAQAATVAAPPAAIVLNFNEPIDQATVGIDDLELDSGVVTSAAALSATSVRYEVRGLIPDGLVSYKLKSAAITDVHGNPAGAHLGSFNIDDPLIHRFRSTNVPQSIPDRGMITSTIQVSAALSIADVDVGLDITHTFDGDLDVFLLAPDGTRVELFTDVGGGGANFVRTVLDDEASVSIQTGGAPFTGRFRPEGQLSALDNRQTLGTWTLQITDDAGADVGTLTGWELIVREDTDIPPRIAAIAELPSDQGTTWSRIDSLSVQFSKPMQAETVNAANWDLRRAGPDQLFDTPDDVLFTVAASPAYTGGLTAHLAIAQGALPPGQYRFQALSSGLLDLSGNPLDGNGDGTAGDPYVRHFAVITVQADPREPNDSFAQATALGPVGNRTETDLSIHAANNDDYYRFTAAMAGILATDVLFSHSAGDINAELYNADQDLLSASASTNDNERLFWNVSTGETYYLRVYGNAGALNPSYTLQLVVSQAPPGDRFEPNDSFAVARDFGTLSNRTEAGLSVHFPGNDDYYRFTPATTGTLAADVLFSHAGGDIDAVLYDANQTRLTYSDSRNNDERIVWNVTAGQTYYLHVHGYDGAINPDYTLQLLVSQSSIADRFEPNDSFATAQDLGSIGSRNEASLSIHTPNNDDYYRFTAAMTGVLTADVLFRHAAGDLDVVLYSANQTWLRDSSSANDDERIVWGVSAGQTYYLRVYGYDGETNSNYALQLVVGQAPAGDRFEPNDSFATATDLGALGSRTEANLSIHFSGNDDYYRFTPQITGLVTANVLFTNANGDIDVDFYNASQTLLTSSASTNDRERIVWVVTAGQTYYLQVYGYDGETNPNYSLEIVVSQAPPGDRFEPNNTFAQATVLGTLGNRTEANLSIHLPDNDDYYRFTAVTSGALTADLLFSHAAGDLDLVLYNANGNELAFSGSSNDNEQIVFNVTAGQTYFLQVFGFLGETNPNYSLKANLGIDGTPGNDTRYLTASADGATLQIYNTNPPAPGSTPVFTWPMNSSLPLTLNMLGGDDTVIVALPDGMSGPVAGLRVDTGGGSDNRLLVRGGSVRIDAISTGGTLDTTVLGNTHLSTGRLAQRGLTLGDTSRLTLLPSGLTSVITSLSVATGATLDIGTGALIVNYSGDSPAATIRQQIIAGRGGPGLGATWNGTGITSSAVAAANVANPESRSVAYAENASLPLGPYTTFRGQTVDNTAIFIVFAHTADANLDGLVNDDDATILGASFAPGAGDAFWALADFDYNGSVDDDDATLLGAFYTPPPAAPLSAPPGPEDRNEVAPTVRSGSRVMNEMYRSEGPAQNSAQPNSTVDEEELIALIAETIAADASSAGQNDHRSRLARRSAADSLWAIAD
jgi:subtilisin family serine protease/subtilisin-like proprotein convertase family protein